MESVATLGKLSSSQAADNWAYTQISRIDDVQSFLTSEEVRNVVSQAYPNYGLTPIRKIDSPIRDYITRELRCRTNPKAISSDSALLMHPRVNPRRAGGLHFSESIKSILLKKPELCKIFDPSLVKTKAGWRFSHFELQSGVLHIKFKPHFSFIDWAFYSEEERVEQAMNEMFGERLTVPNISVPSSIRLLDGGLWWEVTTYSDGVSSRIKLHDCRREPLVAMEDDLGNSIIKQGDLEASLLQQMRGL